MLAVQATAATHLVQCTVARWYSGRSASNFRFWVVLTCILLSSGCCMTSHTSDYTQALDTQQMAHMQEFVYKRFHGRGNKADAACKASTSAGGDECAWPTFTGAYVHMVHMLLQVSGSHLPNGHKETTLASLSVLNCNAALLGVVQTNMLCNIHKPQIRMMPHPGGTARDSLHVSTRKQCPSTVQQMVAGE